MLNYITFMVKTTICKYVFSKLVLLQFIPWFYTTMYNGYTEVVHVHYCKYNMAECTHAHIRICTIHFFVFYFFGCFFSFYYFLCYGSMPIIRYQLYAYMCPDFWILSFSLSRNLGPKTWKSLQIVLKQMHFKIE